MYDIFELANYIVNKCQADGRAIRNILLQAILYQIQLEALRRGKVAFAETFEAWRIGPVLPMIYQHYSNFGAGGIRPEHLRPEDLHCPTPEDRPWIDAIIERIRDMHPWETHCLVSSPDSAWSVTYQNGKGARRRIFIDNMRQEAETAAPSALCASETAEGSGIVEVSETAEVHTVDKALADAFCRLNSSGKSEALKRIIEMSRLVEYTA